MFLGPETDDLGFDQERPHHRVDGDKCIGYFTVSPKGQIYMANIDLSRSTLAGMAARVQENHPLSRILVRLLPRVVRGAARWYQDRRLLQFWIAV